MTLKVPNAVFVFCPIVFFPNPVWIRLTFGLAGFRLTGLYNNYKNHTWDHFALCWHVHTTKSSVAKVIDQKLCPIWKWLFSAKYFCFIIIYKLSKIMYNHIISTDTFLSMDRLSTRCRCTRCTCRAQCTSTSRRHQNMRESERGEREPNLTLQLPLANGWLPDAVSLLSPPCRPSCQIVSLRQVDKTHSVTGLTQLINNVNN